MLLFLFLQFRSKEQLAFYNKSETVMLNSTDNETMYSSEAGKVFNVVVHYLNDSTANVTRSKLFQYLLSNLELNVSC